MKPLKGVISNWRQGDDNRIHGLSEWHADAVPIGRALMSPDNKIANGYPITTSRIVSVKASPSDTFHIVETQNSFYVLINKAKD